MKIGLYIDCKAMSNERRDIVDIIENNINRCVFFNKEELHNNKYNIILFTCGDGQPAKLHFFENTSDNVFEIFKVSHEIFGRTRISNFLKYIKDPYTIVNKRLISAIKIKQVKQYKNITN